MADAPKDKPKEPAKEPVSGEKGYDPTKQPGYQEYPKVVNGTTVGSKEEEDALKSPEKK
jgi:hypothetical protein